MVRAKEHIFMFLGASPVIENSQAEDDIADFRLKNCMTFINHQKILKLFPQNTLKLGYMVKRRMFHIRRESFLSMCLVVQN